MSIFLQISPNILTFDATKLDCQLSQVICKLYKKLNKKTTCDQFESHELIKNCEGKFSVKENFGEKSQAVLDYKSYKQY